MEQADLTRGMEHMRPYVSATPSPSTSANELKPSHSISGSQSAGEEKDSNSQSRVDIRARSPSNPNHRADPSKFGSRYLQEGDDVFEFNAWDAVPLTSEFLEFAEQQYSEQRSHPVSDFDKHRFNDAPEKWWDRFYANNSANFFKDRKWLFKEFEGLRELTSSASGPLTVLEIGCGAGNTAFPLLQNSDNQGLMIHCCDFSKAAVEVVKQSKMFDKKRMRADVWDLASGSLDSSGSQLCSDGISLPPGLTEGSVDLVFLIFVFSALSPSQWSQALRNINAVLKPGGEVLFRDYGRGDLAQVRFKKGRWMEENFYVRGDGTRVYFFDKDELADLFGGSKTDCHRMANGNGTADDNVSSAGGENKPKFEILELNVDRRMLVNRQRRLKMYRCWMQGRFRKPADVETEDCTQRPTTMSETSGSHA